MKYSRQYDERSGTSTRRYIVAIMFAYLFMVNVVMKTYGDRPPLPSATDPKECGRDCLYALLRLHGIAPRSGELAQAVPISDLGASMYNLQQVAAHFGLETEVVKIAPNELSTIPLPAIVHLGLTPQEGHYLVLVGLEEPKYPSFIDSTGGRIKWARGDFIRSWSGYALIVKSRSNALRHYTMWLTALNLFLIAMIVGFRRGTNSSVKKSSEKTLC